MSIDSHPALRRGVAYATVAAMISLSIGACNDTTSTDSLRDRTPPRVTLTPGGSASGTVISFSTLATDNLGLKTIEVVVTGAVTMDTLITFSSAVTNFTLPSTLFADPAQPAGSLVTIAASAIDGAGNLGVDTLAMFTGNVPPPEVRVISPFSGASAVVGRSIVVTVMGKTALKVLSLGLSTRGPVVYTDSVVFASPLADSMTMQDTVVIPANATPGILTITPFLWDSLGRRTDGPDITITVQSPAQVNSVPVVNQYCLGGQAFNNACGHDRRVEVGDTVHVEADDPSGISTLGYEVRRSIGGVIEDTQTFTSNGQLTFVPQRFNMRLPYSTFPTTAYIQVFATNSNGVRAYAKLSNGADRIDTVQVVAGVTRSLPLGGQVADALYHPGKDRLYLTNIQRNQLEVFNLSDSSFKAPVIVGSRPWGLAGWPRNRAGDMGDTVLVANSGGTNISYVDLNAGLSGSGLEVFRYALPNIVAYTVTSVLSSTTNQPIRVRTVHDFSDRPQFLGATCIAPAADCTEIVVAYSTTPTAGQSEPFSDRMGTLRWENLTRGVTAPGLTDLRTSHFFFEQAIGQTGARGDTLEVVRYDANGVDATTLVPFIDPVTLQSMVVTIPKLAFRDTTFVRGSGNFRRAVFGEGGNVLGSRAMMYDVDRGPNPTYPYIDLGVAQPAEVSDFIANTFARITGAAISFDGSLSAIRADSTYILNPALRLQGVLNTTFSNAGLDFHPRNTGLNSFPTNTRLAFAASSEPLIEIFDTNCYQRVGTVPIKDPIIGPIKAAFQVATGQLVLVGATTRGVVIAQLPNTFTTSCP